MLAVKSLLLFVIILLIFSGIPYSLGQGSGALECGQSVTLESNPVQIRWGRYLEPTGMLYNACTDNLGMCSMTNIDGTNQYKFEFSGGLHVSSPDGSQARLVIYLNNQPSGMTYNLTQGANDLTGVSFSPAYYEGVTSSLYVSGSPNTVITVRPPDPFCTLAFQWGKL